jgi:hypothetical protein
MMNHPSNHNWTMPEPPRGFPPPPGLSTKALLVSLLSMGTVGAAALFVLHAAVCGNYRFGSQQRLGIAEVQPMTAPAANAIPTTPPVALTAASNVRSTAATPKASPTTPAANRTVTFAPISRPHPKPASRASGPPLHLSVESTPTRSEPVPPPPETSGANPYDEPSGITTPPVPRQAADSSSENALDRRE